MACLLALCKLLSLMQGSSAGKMGSRTRLVFFFGSNVTFSFSQTQPWLVFRCYVNFFFFRSGLAREKMGSQTRLVFFFGSNVAFSFSQTQLWLVFLHYVNFFFSCKGLGRENQALGPGLASFPGLARSFLPLRPDHSLFFSVM